LTKTEREREREREREKTKIADPTRKPWVNPGDVVIVVTAVTTISLPPVNNDNIYIYIP
jgi:hypothetical protein